MGRDRIKFVYAGALIALVIELLLIINNYFGDNLYVFRGVEANAIEPLINKVEPDFLGMLSLTWSSLIGTIGLCILFVYRLIKGASPSLELLATAFWIIQIYFLFNASKPALDNNMASYDFFGFFLAYILAFLGIVAMLIVVVYDYLARKKSKN